MMSEHEARAEARVLMEAIERAVQFADKHEAFLVAAKLAEAQEAMRHQFLPNEG